MIAMIVLLILCAGVVVASAGFRKMQRSIPRDDFILHSAPDASTVHELVFAIQQKNLPELDTMLMERSTPGSSLYQHWLTFDEVGRMTSNEAGASAVVEWLTSNHIEVAWESAHRDYIKAVAPVSKWEQLLQTTFNVYEDLSRNNTANTETMKYIRAADYSLPVHIIPHLSAVFNTVQTPPSLAFAHRLSRPETHHNKPNSHLRGDTQFKTMDFHSANVEFLNDLYNITSNGGDSTQQQAVMETSDEHFSPDDLALFQLTFNVPQQPALDPSNYGTTDCYNQSCFEGNLDLQYMMGIAHNTSTVFWHVAAGADPFVTWITEVADLADPPLVNSISWGSIEQGRSQDTLDAFNTEALKLAIMGVTIVVAAGDNGAGFDETSCASASGSSDNNPGFWTGTPWTGVGYYPSFPATSPYVTAVGATMGPENGLQEVACQSQLGGVITSGGGFSTYYPQPSWQTEAVAQYLASLPVGQQPTDGYNSHGRAYPDVSLIGVWYDVFVQSQLYSLFGTSAAAPVFAAMVSLMNAARAREGKRSLGFLNPTLYMANHTSLFNDVTSGHNHCLVNGDINNPSSAVCCSSGFYAAVGWDPVTGHGSLNYDKFVAMYAPPIPTREPTTAPTATPTQAPTQEPTGTAAVVTKQSSTLSAGEFLGVVLGSVAFIMIAAAAVLFVPGLLSPATPIVPVADSVGAMCGMDMPVQSAVQVKPGAGPSAPTAGASSPV